MRTRTSRSFSHGYQTKGYTQYGAQMGRRSDTQFEGPVQARRVPIDQQGYDPGGAYWGTGGPLFIVFDNAGHEAYARAPDAASAVAKVAPQATISSATEVSTSDIDDMFSGYVEAALWSSSDDKDMPLDSEYSTNDFTRDALKKMRADCTEFAKVNARTILSAIEKSGRFGWDHVGHDFWLTRNGHGAGFWDGDWPKQEGQMLTDACKKFGEQHIEAYRKKLHVF